MNTCSCERQDGYANCCKIKRLEIEIGRMQLAQRTLFESIKHGDTEHQDWRLEKIESHFIHTYEKGK